MKKIIFEGWEVGMKKISFTKMLKANSHLGLKEAKSINDRLLNNEVIEVEFETEEIAKVIAEESRKLGVICKLK
jgi:ribosomal protein L7/L12